MFGFGLVCWFVLGSLILARLFFGPPLPATLVPTLAIEVAPAAVAGLAWFALTDGRIGVVTQFLAGCGLLMVLVQVRFVPLYRRLSFSAAFWSFTFAWAAVVTVVLQWLASSRSPVAAAAAWSALLAITAVIGGIAVRTLVALIGGETVSGGRRSRAGRCLPGHPDPGSSKGWLSIPTGWLTPGRIPVRRRNPARRATPWSRPRRTPLRSFVRTETGSAVLLLAAAVAALGWVAIDPGSYRSVWQTPLGLRLGSQGIEQDLRGWINNGLMTVFFFVIGLEARRAFDLGELRERRRVLLPVLAGTGGMVVCVGIYLALNAGRPSAAGWGIALSTDTAFALALLSLARAPPVGAAAGLPGHRGRHRRSGGAAGHRHRLQRTGASRSAADRGRSVWARRRG